MGEPARHRRRRDGAAGAAPDRSRGRPPRPAGASVFFGDRRHETPIYARERLAGEIEGPAVIEEFGSTLADPPRLRRARGRDRQHRRAEDDVIDPILVEIVQGTLASIEAEVEEAIGRTARSPMIRDQHDFRAGIHDRQLRKLTGRSYSALVHPIVRDFPLEDDAARRRLLPQRRLPVRGRRRAPAGPVRDGPGVRGRRGRRVRAGLRPPRRHRRHGAGIDALGRPVGVPGGPDGPAGEAVRRRRAERGRAADRRAQLAHAGVARRRHRRRVRGHADGRAARGGAVRALRPRGRRGVLRRDHRVHDGDVPARGAGEDPRRRLPLGGLRRARRRRPAAPARAADDADQDRRPARDRLHGHRPAGEGADQPRRRLRRGQLPQEVAGADPAQPRRHARADGGARRQRGRRRADRDAVPAAGHAS